MQETREYTELIGKVFGKIRIIGDDQLVFTTIDGQSYRFYHNEDCKQCDVSVEINDIVGNLADLLKSPITMADEVSYKQQNPEGVKTPDDQEESFTWTFYKFATVKGYVTVRWYGESNGYYSESVDFERVS